MLLIQMFLVILPKVIIGYYILPYIILNNYTSHFSSLSYFKLSTLRFF
jgi:hypothetical protein